MPLTEFDLIQQYFVDKQKPRTDVWLGIGDDGALLQVPAEQSLVVSTDTVIEAVHFPQGTQARDIAYKALAVNLSDLAAMGAIPAWFTLALTLPRAEEAWLTEFSAGLFELSNRFQIQLIGGDTTCGPLSLTITVHGFVPHEKALRRSGAQVGDKIYVSGTLGDAGLGLRIALGELEIIDKNAKNHLLNKLNRPTPQVALGLLLRDFATSAIDISDGLTADLGHLLKASNVGARIETDKLPLSETVRTSVSPEVAQQLALTAGDDYELCFTLLPTKEAACLEALTRANITVTCIGEVTAETELKIAGFTGVLNQTGFQHF